MILPVVKGLEGLVLHLADGVQAVAGDLLGNGLDVVSASLQGEDEVEGVGQTDLLEGNLLLGSPVKPVIKSQ